MQNLSHPIMTRTNAWNGLGRIEGSRSGSYLGEAGGHAVARAAPSAAGSRPSGAFRVLGDALE